MAPDQGGLSSGSPRTGAKALMPGRVGWDLRTCPPPPLRGSQRGWVVGRPPLPSAPSPIPARRWGRQKPEPQGPACGIQGCSEDRHVLGCPGPSSSVPRPARSQHIGDGGVGGWCLKAATWASRGLLDVCGRAHPGQGSRFGRLAWITRPACLPQVKGSRQPGSLGLQATAPAPAPLATRPRAHRVGGMSVPGEKPDLRRGRASLWPPADCCRWPLAHCGHWGSDSARLRAGVPPPSPLPFEPAALRERKSPRKGRVAQT